MSYFEGVNLANLKKEQMRRMRRNMQLIFQDPYASLDPRMTAGDIIGEPIKVHKLAKAKNTRNRWKNFSAW